MDTSCVFVDVSEVPPPEPLAIAMEAAEQLLPGQYLHIHHWREPLLLYQRLLKKQFNYETCQGDAESCEIFVWRVGDQIAERLLKQVTVELKAWRSNQ